MASEESDEHESSLSLHNVLSELSIAGSSSGISSPARLSARPSFMLARRTSPREQSRSMQEADTTAVQTPLFTNPNRSIFSSGPPTSSLSVNQAHASMSSPQAASSHPLSALSSPSLSNTRRQVQPSAIPTPSRRSRFSRVEKDVDDPSVSMDDTIIRRGEASSTSLAVSNLFAAPDLSTSRSPSYVQPISRPQYVRGRKLFF
jgi:hypothetical protein